MSVQEFKCPACAAALKWGSGEQKLKCEYCDNTYDIETLREFTAEEAEAPVEEYAWQPYEDLGDVDSGIKSYICKSCGGQITGEETTAATHCPYCDSPVVLNNNVSGMLKPDFIIPFKVSKDQAMEALGKFCLNKPLLPKDFVSENRLEEITGLYVPFWMFDAKANAKIRYEATKSQHWTEGDYDVTRTDYFMVIREGGAAFDYVPVDGSTKMDDTYMEAIEPFDITQSVDFEMAYLSGFLADKYDVSSDDSKPRANQRVKTGIEMLMRNTVVGYETVIPKNTSVMLEEGKINYAMLPVWILSTNYKGKIYRFAMNGQTGKFVGELPVSWAKFWAFFFGITGGIALIATLIQAFLL